MQKVPNLKLGFIKPLHNIIIHTRFGKAPTNEEKWGHAPKYHSKYTILASSWRGIYIYIIDLLVIIIFISAVKKFKNSLKFLQLRWGKNCQVILLYLDTKHYWEGALGQAVNSNVKQILRTLDIVSSWHWEKLTFTENNLIIAGMVKVLLGGYLSKMGSWESGKEAGMHACKI
jgi:hypothetical protein